MATGAIIAIIVVISSWPRCSSACRRSNRRRRLRERFGPEYDRTVSERGQAGSRGELAEREAGSGS